jgi:peptidoglycan/xylan/chitin deacetylase (PgdA/CDA1 family)
MGQGSKTRGMNGYVGMWLRRALAGALLIVFGLATAGRTPRTAVAQTMPHLAGTLPAIEQPMLGALQRAGLAGRVVRIAADTNGVITVASLVFTYRATGGSVLRDLQEYAWNLVTTAFASGPEIEEIDLTGFHDPGGAFDATRRDATFTLAVSAQEFSRLPRSALASQGFRTLTRVWYYPALLASADTSGDLARHSAAVSPTSAVAHRERTPAFSGSPAERAVESAHQRRGERTGAVIETKVYRGNPASPRLALTFDDGPVPLYTTLLLDTLDRVGAKATFFLIGLRVQQYPYLAQAIAERGHELGNHSFHHPNLARLPEAQLPGELAATQRAIESATGITPRYFRPPGGDYNAAVLRAAGALGLTTVFWTDDPADYARPSLQLLERKLLGRVSNGGILLLHQGVAQTIDILPPTVRILRREGYVITTVGGLLAAAPSSR